MPWTRLQACCREKKSSTTIHGLALLPQWPPVLSVMASQKDDRLIFHRISKRHVIDSIEHRIVLQG
ncbi:hypothetical protein SMJ63A_50177 [Stenotrophomonas geniculata]